MEKGMAACERSTCLVEFGSCPVVSRLGPNLDVASPHMPALSNLFYLHRPRRVLRPINEQPLPQRKHGRDRRHLLHRDFTSVRPGEPSFLVEIANTYPLYVQRTFQG